jgi:outer membrane receptor protein involved in Fe transport
MMVKRCFEGMGFSLLLLAGLPVSAQDLAYVENATNTLEPDSVMTKKEVVELHEVKVTGRSKIRILKEAAMPVSVLGARQLEGTATSINDVLARTAGVTIRNTGGVGSASRVSVRGLEGKRMGIYVDEAAIGQLSDYMSLNDIPTDMIERIEIYKGIVPYRFGGSALGGAVNVVTKEYPPVYLDASYEISSFNTHKMNFAFKRTNSATGLQFGLGGCLTYSDNDYTMKLQNLDNRKVKRDHDQFKKIMFGGSLKATKWYFDEAKLEVIFMGTKAEIQGIDSDIREAYNHGMSGIAALKLTRDDFLTEGLDLDFDGCYSYGKNGLVDKAMYRYDWEGNRYPAVSTYGGEQGNYASDSDNRTNDWVGKLNLNYLLSDHHALNLNLYATHTRQNPSNELMDKSFGYQTNFPSRMSSFTAGFSYDLTLFDGKFLAATTLKNFTYSSHTKVLQFTYINNPTDISLSRNHWGASEALRYKLTKELMVKASFSSEVRIPSAEELTGNGYSILPATDLEPERCKGLNAGVLFHHPNQYGFIEIEANYFLNQLDNMIRYQADMIPSMARYANFGKVVTKGIEGEVKGDLTSFLYAYVNATYQDLRDKRKNEVGSTAPNATYNKRMPNIPYFLANFGVELHQENLFGGKGQNTRLLYDASYIHEYFYDFEVSKYQDRKIPTSFTMDAGIEHSFQNNRWTLSFKVKNLADRMVYSDLNRPLPGRSFAFKIKYVMK